MDGAALTPALCVTRVMATPCNGWQAEAFWVKGWQSQSTWVNGWLSQATSQLRSGKPTSSPLEKEKQALGDAPALTSMTLARDGVATAALPPSDGLPRHCT